MTQHLIMRGVIPRIKFVSDGILSEYDFPFAIFKNSDLKVYFGSEVQDTTTYSVSGAGDSDGGTVTLSNVPESGVVITLTRELPIERTSDFQEGGALRANTLNHELDYQIACQQQIADNLNRSMVLPPYAADSDVKLTLPIPSAGKAIVWNADGTNLENSTVAINALESTLKGYKDSAESAATIATTKASEAIIQAQTATNKASEAASSATAAAQSMLSKVNIDFDNLSATGKNNLINCIMPDYSSSVDITSSKVAPNLGICDFHGKCDSGHFYNIYVNGKFVGRVCGTQTSGETSSFIFRVKPNDVVSWSVNAGTAYSQLLTFYPLNIVQVEV